VQDTVSGRDDIHVVGSHQKANVELVSNPAYQLYHGTARHRVQITGRLIGDYKAGIVHQRSRQRHPLLLTT
jgi:hypothetical protein